MTSLSRLSKTGLVLMSGELLNFLSASNTPQVVSAANPLPVIATIVPSGTQNVNLTQVGGAAIALGQALMAASLPVVIASNQSALSVNASQVGAPWTVQLVAGTAVAGSVQISDGTVSAQKLAVSANGVAAFNLQTTGGVSASIAAGGDAQSSSMQTLYVRNFNYIFNGTTLDRQAAINGIDGTGKGVTATEVGGSTFVEITTATSTTVKGSAGTLHKVIVNTGVAAATIKIYNALSATGTPFTITCSGTAPFEITYDTWMSTGIFVVTSGATDVTITYR